MITPSTPAFYVLRAHEHAAELITGTISPSAMTDITDALILSIEFDNEIVPIQEIDAAVQTIAAGLVGHELERTETFNPLFYPSTDEVLDEVLDVQIRGEIVRFTGVDGDPFIAKALELRTDGAPALEASVSFRPFDLPGYESIMEGRSAPLN